MGAGGSVDDDNRGLRVKRHYCSLALVSVAALTVMASTGCGRSAPPPVRGTASKRVDPATVATIRGRVVFAGAIPKNAAIAMSSDAFCVHVNPGQLIDDSVLVGPEGGLQNAFVYVKDDLSAYAFDKPAAAARIEQKGCRFTPHVIGLRVGQTLELANRDETLHNVHAITKLNDDFNIGATPGAVFTRTFTTPETMITFKCDVHSWMTAYAGVLAHPYFAVTDANGHFELQGLPPGEYSVAAWHEKFGTRVDRVRVGPNGSNEISFTFGGV
jgi:plastocyanin